MPGRVMAIGDVHGCAAALRTLLAAVDPQPDDTVVTLGDYIDRGPDSRDVVQQLLELEERCRLVPLLGNHEEMLFLSMADPTVLGLWLGYGGGAALRSYGVDPTGVGPADLKDRLPTDHLTFLRACRACFTTDTHFFVHAGYVPDLPLDHQPVEALRWRSLTEWQPRPHQSGKIAVVGHTPQRSGRILDLGFLKAIDTWCHHGGWLTALEVESGEVTQANERGELRRG